MFNVGEGECILVAFPNERAWIIDCGSGNSTGGDNQKLGAGVGAYLLERGLKLEALIPSHPHIDHAGGYRSLLEAGPLLAPKVWLFRGNEAWDPSRTWINDLDNATSALAFFEEVALEDSERVFVIDDDITAHLFAGAGDGAYTSIWLHIRYHESRLLLTGDVHCPNEKRLLWLFGDYDFGSDLLKITHHGSSSGTGVEFLQRVRPGLSIASTANDDGHRLEQDTLDRLGGLGSPRRVFETHVDGDIVVLTDGLSYGDGILFDVDFEAPGRFAADLGASVLPLATVDEARTSSANPGCD
jgi:competence protein ComEC